jgi:putative lipoprotein
MTTMTVLSRYTISLALLIAASHTAYASIDCSGSHGGFRFQTQDSWTGTDKLEHFGVSAPFGAIGGWLARDTDHPVIYGTLIGTVPGVLKETLDGTCRTDGFSYKDLFADALGALTGAWLTHWGLSFTHDSHSQTFGLRYDNVF